jgi:putative toxin-antitoxin system antitoxin component (TIGR02293 family)
MNTVQILTFLGGKTKDGNLLATIKAGLPPRAIAILAERAGVARAVLLQKLDISESTLARRTRARKKLTAQESDRLVRIARVYAYATEVFGSEEKARLWMQHPIRALNFTAPFEYLDTEEGARQVETVLSHLEHGVFS